MTLFTGGEVATITTGRPRLGVLVRFDTPTPVRAWGGVGDLPVPVDAVETGGATYKGVGALQGLPILSQLINGVAEKVSFSLSGLDPTLLALADASAADLRFVQARVGVFTQGQDWQPASTVKWIWLGSVDTPKVSRSPGPFDGPQIRTISVEVGTAHTSRSRPRHSAYTDSDQQRRFPGDRSCERVIRYNAGSTRKWPNY